MRILLADDDKNFASILKQELEDESFIVDVVANGVEAVMNFIGKAYDFLLMDLKMPRLSGVDALKIIKKIKPDIPCITFSGKAGSTERAEAVQSGAMKCLQKPFPIFQLKEEIKKYIPEPEENELPRSKLQGIKDLYKELPFVASYGEFDPNRD